MQTINAIKNHNTLYFSCIEKLLFLFSSRIINYEKKK